MANNNDKKMELDRLKQMQKEYGITDEMLQETEADLSPNRLRQRMPQKPKSKTTKQTNAKSN
jgi:hypothetical protein